MFGDYNNVKRKYYEEKDINYRIEKGQIFTPKYIADFMAEWVLYRSVLDNRKELANRLDDCNHDEKRRILDPAVGLGVFFQSLLNHNNDNIKIYGIEKDSQLVKESKKLYKNHGAINIHQGNYLEQWDNKYDGIICNPPYLIYKKYNNEKYISLINKELDLKLSGYTNMAMLFLVKSLFELKEKAKMAYIVPVEFMNADYGKEIKKTIVESRLLRYVIILNYNIFEVKTTSVILLFSNDSINESKIKFINIDSREQFFQIFYNNNKIPGFDNTIINNEMDIEKKWSFYYRKNEIPEYKNMVEFNEYARVYRGIATGANDFFLLDEEKKDKYNINKDFLLPVITKAAYVKDPIFTIGNYNKLKNEGKKIYLFNGVNNENNKNVKKYIHEGEENRFHKRYLTRNRKPWYKLENKPPSSILVKTFFREKIQFIINKASVYNLTAFHNIYTKIPEYDQILEAYFLTDIAVELIELNRREYSNGLFKIEPGDINKSFIPDFKIIKENDREDIINIYEKYQTERNKKEKLNKSPEDLLDKLNSIFLKYLV